MSLFLIVPSSLVMSIIAILTPLLSSPENLPPNTKTAVKIAFFISLIPPTCFINQNSETITISWHWLTFNSFDIDLTLQFDLYSMIFVPIALFVTWSILEFSLWYMHEDPMINTFFKYLLVFLLAMVTLVTAGNLFILFLGWEGVGIMSFMLIGWYHARSNAGTAALQAMLYNRIGDIGFLFAISWLLTNSGSLNFHYILTLDTNTPLLIALIAAAASKSAQFSLHPWLASAMEGPTPVSALLHSSTMVVAGIFLLIRLHPLLETSQLALSTCLCLGAISTAFAATCALTQNDMKKIIAYSTSSQLGLMMVAIGLNFPHLAFFHICTHAFFKAMLFLCSGSIIHNLADEQDIRKMGGLQNLLPISMSAVSIGSFALMGTPYLAGFFSKDVIIEASSTSYANAWAVILTMIATSFTAAYSLRMIFLASMKTPRINTIIIMNENNPLIINPLKRLATGSIIAGFLILQLTLPNNPMTHTMPAPMKLLALLITATAFIIAFDLAKLSWSTKPPLFLPLSKTMDTAFFTLTLHRLLPTSTLNTGSKTISNLLDIIWLEKMGPKGLATAQLPPIKTLQDIQLGLIKTYLTAFILTLTLSLMILQLA